MKRRMKSRENSSFVVEVAWKAFFNYSLKMIPAISSTTNHIHHNFSQDGLPKSIQSLLIVFSPVADDRS